MQAPDSFISVEPSSGVCQRWTRFRVCASCQSQQSPTWRSGPHGETWCNKCGLRNRRMLKRSSTACASREMESSAHPARFFSTIVIDAPSVTAQGSPNGDQILISLDSSEETKCVHEIQNQTMIEQSVSLGHENRGPDYSEGSQLSRGAGSSGHEIEDRYDDSSMDDPKAPLTPAVQVEQITSCPDASPSRFPTEGCGTLSKYRFVVEYRYRSTQRICSHALTHQPAEGRTEQCQCRRLFCVCAFLCQRDLAVPELAPYGQETCLRFFYHRTAAVHLDALKRKSSVYAVGETFIYDHANENVTLTAFAFLREDYDGVESPSCSSPSLTALEVARSDLVFGSVITSIFMFPPDDWLHRQLLVDHLSSERARSAIWDISRLPTGPHLSDSQTFQWVARTLVANRTCSSPPQYHIDIHSGSNLHPFRRFHEVLAKMKRIRIANDLKTLRQWESKMLDVCMRACQEWFIAVADEASKISTKESQLGFLEANKAYMSKCMAIHRDSFQKMNVEKALHICSIDCSSHLQPTFDTVVRAGQDALLGLFPQEKVLSSYPTKEQLFLARVIGMAQFKLYYSIILLDKEQRSQFASLELSPIAQARLELFTQSQSKLIWNYLPPNVADAAAAKLDSALKAYGSTNHNRN